MISRKKRQGNALETLRELHKSCRSTCITTSCRRGRCVLILPSDGTLCIDCDKCSCFKPGASKPDFIVLYAESQRPSSYWFIVEMKRPTGHPRHITTQLQAGAHAIDSCPSFRLSTSVPLLLPVVLHQGGIHADDFDTLRKQRISFHGERIALSFQRCGTMLDRLT
jgi:hypothetical protein